MTGGEGGLLMMYDREGVTMYDIEGGVTVCDRE